MDILGLCIFFSIDLYPKKSLIVVNMKFGNLSAALAFLNASSGNHQPALFNASNHYESNIPHVNGSWPDLQIFNFSYPYGRLAQTTISLSVPTLQERCTCAADQAPCTDRDSCTADGGALEARRYPNTTVGAGVDRTVLFMAGTSRSIFSVATGSSSKLRPPRLLGTLQSVFVMMSSRLIAHVHAEDAGPEGNKGRNHISYANNKSPSIKKHDNSAGERFVPPNFDKDAWLDDYEKRPRPRPNMNAASQMAYNPFSHPVTLFSSVLGSLRKAKATSVIANDTACEHRTSLKGLGLGSALFDMWKKVKMASS